MDELIEFYRARLDEDEQAAKAVLGVNVVAGMKRGDEPPHWVPSPEGDAAIWDTNGTPRVKFAWARERDHILRHDPARVLRKVEAGRKLIELCGKQWTHDLRGTEGGLELALELAAQEWADHEDFDERWRT